MIHSKNKKLLRGVIILLAIGILLLGYRIGKQRLAAQREPTKPETAVTYTPTTKPEIKDDKPVTIPPSLLLKVPWTPQAPTANWDELHNEACEEASALMVDAYYKGITDERLSPEYAEKEIAKLTEWQKANFGYYLSINTEEVARMIESVYSLNTEIIHGFTETDLKRILAQDKLIILPLAGQELDNPNFRSPGPVYHMLVVTGYDKEGFITNEPGTRKGYNYRYSFETLHSATGQWDGTTHTIDTSIKPVIIISK
jgi:hypothetical protein